MSKRILMKIQGMECPNCSMILERIEDKLEGVLRAEGSYHKAQLIVEYREELVSQEKIIEFIEQLGYGVRSSN